MLRARTLVKECLRMGGVPTCAYCRKTLTKDTATIDHKQPLARGGTNARANLVLSCAGCNYDKGHRTPEEYKAGVLVLLEPRIRAIGVAAKAPERLGNDLCYECKRPCQVGQLSHVECRRKIWRRTFRASRQNP